MEKGASRLMSGDLGSAPKPAARGTNAAPDVAAKPGPLTPEQMQDSVTAAQVLTDADYAPLSAARAKVVQSYLITNLQVVAERVLIGDPESGAFGTNGHRVTLQLQ